MPSWTTWRGPCAPALGARRLAETVEQGTAFAADVAALTGKPQSAAALPVVVGRACAFLPLPAREIIGLYLQAQAAALISAAERFLLLGPVEGQAVLAGLQPALLAAAARAGTGRPVVMAALRHGRGVAEIADFLIEQGGLDLRGP